MLGWYWFFFCTGRFFFNITLFSSVIVSPHGIRGRFTGCCASDVVKQICSRYFIIYGMLFTWQISLSVFSILLFIYLFIFICVNSSGKSRTSYGFVGLPHHVSQGRCQSKGQNCYVEVTLGCPRSGSEKPLQSNSNYMRNVSIPQVTESLTGRGDLKGSSNHLSSHKKTFIYPPEAVLVLLLQTSFARSSLKR